jgi:hypothetical protein
MQGDDDGCYGNDGGGVRDYVRVGNYDVVGGYGSPAQGSDGGFPARSSHPVFISLGVNDGALTFPPVGYPSPPRVFVEF